MHSLIKRLRKDFPDINFISGETFMWSHTKHTIFYTGSAPEGAQLLLHELAHAILEHKEYDQDVQLITREQEAWEYARNELGPKYGVSIVEDTIQECLNSYRVWLHDRSRCPVCGENVPQTTNGTYLCHLCGCSWRANDAKMCELRRFVIKPQS